MSGYDDLDGSFRSLNDTLQHRLKPSYDEAVHAAWLGALAHAAAIARAKDQWDLLPEDDPSFAKVIESLDAASREIAKSDGCSDVLLLQAISRAEDALDLVDGLLGGGEL